MGRLGTRLIGGLLVGGLAAVAAMVWYVNTRPEGDFIPSEPPARRQPSATLPAPAPSPGRAPVSALPPSTKTAKLIPPAEMSPGSAGTDQLSRGFDSGDTDTSPPAPTSRDLPSGRRPPVPAQVPPPSPSDPGTRHAKIDPQRPMLPTAGFLSTDTPGDSAEEAGGAFNSSLIVPLSPGTGSGTSGAGSPTSAPLSQQSVADPPQFRVTGLAIGDAVNITPTGSVTFPLTLQLRFDPREPQEKGVPPELITVFYYDEQTGQWSTDGLTVTRINVSEGLVEFQTTHLTVFRLGIPRGRPPVITAVTPSQAGPGALIEILGQGFSPVAAQNVLTLGGAFVTLALDAGRQIRSLELPDTGSTLILRRADGVELDQAVLAAPSARRNSWTRAQEGQASSEVVPHSPGFFSPGTRVNGEPFEYAQAAPPRPPIAGELVINEVLLAPPTSFFGDANGDGETQAQEDEFVEVVNATDHPLELGGCVLLVGGTERHRFPDGLALPGGMALVIFGVNDPATPPEPAGLFGGTRFFPEQAAADRLVARVPAKGLLPGASFLTVGVFRQTSNPVGLQLLSPLIGPLIPFLEAPEHMPLLTGHQPTRLTAADVDRDFDVDLVALDHQAELLILLNDGFGRFTEASNQVTLPEDRNRFFDLAVTDVTDDGAPELIVGDTDAAGSYTQLIALENDGRGRFQVLSTSGVLNSPASSGPVALDLGDADRDGDLDAAVAVIGDAPMLFRQNSDGTFLHDPLRDLLPQVMAVSPTSIRFAELNRDGDPDLLLTAGRAGLGNASAVQVFVNQAAGVFADVTASHIPLHRGGADTLALGDVDGDGDHDMVVGARSASAALYLNNGDGTFVDAGSSEWHALQPASLVLADLDGDGDLDGVAAAAQDAVLQNDATGHFMSVNVLPDVPDGHQQLIPADVDRDGDLDLIGVGSTIRVFLNPGRRVNQPPRLSAVADQRVMEGVPLQFEAAATDADGDPMTLTATQRGGASLESVGAAFSDQGQGRGLFSWTPAADQGVRGGRRYEFLIVASDGIASDERTVGVIVDELNHPPALAAIPSVTVDELEPLTLQLVAGDPDAGDVLTFGTVGQPTGSSFHTATGLFLWTPGPRQGDGPGGQLDYPIAFTVTDLAQVTADRSMTVTVRHRNHAPAWIPVAGQDIMEGQELVLTLQVSDPDQDVIMTQAPALPSGATWDPDARTLRWTPNFSQSRIEPYAIRLQASDGELTGELVIQVTVSEFNRAPEFTNFTDQAVDEGRLLQLTVLGQDPDGDPVTFAVIGALPPGAVFDTVTHQLTWTPTFAQAGRHTVTLEISDGRTARQHTIFIDVANVDRSPVLEPIPDQTIQEGQALAVPIEASDPDGDALTITFQPPLPRGAALIQQAGAFVLQWVPDMAQAGTYPLEVHATDGLTDLVATFTIEVLDDPLFQPLLGDVGMALGDVAPAARPLGALGTVSFVTFRPGDSVGLDRGAVHPAAVTMLELFTTSPAVPAVPASDLALWVSDDNLLYVPYEGSWTLSASRNRLTLSGLHIPQRFIKLHWTGNTPAASLTNFLPQLVRASGSLTLDDVARALIDDQAQRAFELFADHVNSKGLMPDRITMSGDRGIPGPVFSTAATGLWLASLPIAVDHGWMTSSQAEAKARQTLDFFLGKRGGPVEGQFGFFYHFLNDDGTRFRGFDGDGVSILDSTILLLGALACGEYFGGEVHALSRQLYDQADWEAFYDHVDHQLRMVWTPERGFERHLDYYSEGVLAYLLAAGSTTHPIQPDDRLAAGADAYYAFSRGNFGRVLGRFGREGRPLLQSYFGSLFTHLMPALLVDASGLRDAFHFDWTGNTREAIVANFRFAQAHPEFGYNRLRWGISASDGPAGYQGRYGTPPLDSGAGGELHDGTIAPYAVAGSLSLAADLALPALQELAAVSGGSVNGRYGLKSGVNLQQGFISTDYLGLDHGLLLLGLDSTGQNLVARLVRQSPVIQRALEQVGFHAEESYRLERLGPRSAHAYVLVDTMDHLTQTIDLNLPPANVQLAGDYLLELHPYGMDTALDEQFVDVQVRLNGELLQTVRFVDRRGDGTVDVGSVYVPIPQARITQQDNIVTLTWVAGERWVQLEDVELRSPTGRAGTQEHWQIGVPDGSYQEFEDERLADDSHLVGDAPATFERALNAVDEPVTDILFELRDVGVDRQLVIVASETQAGRPVTVEVIVNNAVSDLVTLSSGEGAVVDVSRFLLREGWNHLALRHANVPGEGEFILWDTVALEPRAGSDDLDVIVRDVLTGQPLPQIQFGLAGPGGAVLAARQYLEVRYQADATFDRITISTDNRQAPIHRFTGPSEASAAGLVGVIDPGIVAPLLWQVYNDPQASPPAFTDTTEWAFVPDRSDAGFDTPEGMDYRTVVSRQGLGDRPQPGRPAEAPVAVYLVADFRGKPAQAYATDRLLIERIDQ